MKNKAFSWLAHMAVITRTKEKRSKRAAGQDPGRFLAKEGLW